ncbi:MAG: tyrosine-type recombinase/integrase [Nanoarchaeota archaeon]
MEQKLDPQNFEIRYNSTIRKLEESDISERNKRIILRFKDNCIRCGLGKPRVVKLIETMELIAIILDKDLDQVKKRDVERYITIIQERNYTAWTRHDYKVVIKKFYKWLKGKNEFYPDEVKWIKCAISRNEQRLPAESELLTEDDIKKLIENAGHPRDKAFIALLFESGCRIGELLTLRIKNISFDEHGILMNVNGKTGSRRIRIIAATNYLATWLDCHPSKKDLESPVWVNIGTTNHHKIMKYQTARNSLILLFKKCNINKRHNPHFFRHSRATYLANHLTEFQMNQYLGWVQGSGMPATYIHMSGKETDAALLVLNGVKLTKEEKESSLKPIKCHKCTHINNYDAKFCSKCAGILDIKTAMQLEDKRLKESELRNKSDELMNKLINDPEVYMLIMEKIATMGLNK